MRNLLISWGFFSPRSFDCWTFLCVLFARCFRLTTLHIEEDILGARWQICLFINEGWRSAVWARFSIYRIVTEIFCTLLLFYFLFFSFRFLFALIVPLFPGWRSSISLRRITNTRRYTVRVFLSLFRPCCPLMPAIHSCLSYIFISSLATFCFLLLFFFWLHAFHQLDKLDSRHTHAFNRWQKALFSFFLHIPFFLFSFFFSFLPFPVLFLAIVYPVIRYLYLLSPLVHSRRPDLTVWRRVDWETLCRGVARHGCT